MRSNRHTGVGSESIQPMEEEPPVGSLKSVQLQITDNEYDSIIWYWETYKIRPNWPDVPTFSCNADREKWPTIRYGNHPICEREFVEIGEIPVLDRIVEIVVWFYAEGKRFQVHESGVVVVDTGQYLCEFEFSEC